MSEVNDLFWPDARSVYFVLPLDLLHCSEVIWSGSHPAIRRPLMQQVSSTHAQEAPVRRSDERPHHEPLLSRQDAARRLTLSPQRTARRRAAGGGRCPRPPRRSRPMSSQGSPPLVSCPSRLSSLPRLAFRPRYVLY